MPILRGFSSDVPGQPRRELKSHAVSQAHITALASAVRTGEVSILLPVLNIALYGTNAVIIAS